MTYHAVPCHAIPYHTIPYHTKPYHTIPYYNVPYHSIPYHTKSYHTIIDLQAGVAYFIFGRGNFVSRCIFCLPAHSLTFRCYQVPGMPHFFKRIIYLELFYRQAQHTLCSGVVNKVFKRVFNLRACTIFNLLAYLFLSSGAYFCAVSPLTRAETSSPVGSASMSMKSSSSSPLFSNLAKSPSGAKNTASPIVIV